MRQPTIGLEIEACKQDLVLQERRSVRTALSMFQWAKCLALASLSYPSEVHSHQSSIPATSKVPLTRCEGTILIKIALSQKLRRETPRLQTWRRWSRYRISHLLLMTEPEPKAKTHARGAHNAETQQTRKHSSSNQSVYKRIHASQLFVRVTYSYTLASSNLIFIDTKPLAFLNPTSFHGAEAQFFARDSFGLCIKGRRVDSIDMDGSF